MVRKMCDRKKHLLIYEEESTPCGFMNFTEIEDVRHLTGFLSPKSQRAQVYV